MKNEDFSSDLYLRKGPFFRVRIFNDLYEFLRCGMRNLYEDRREMKQMLHTALSATHMVDISLRDPGGGEMIKVRLQGTKEDMEWLESQLRDCQHVKITESSATFGNKGTSKYYRKYLEVSKKEKEE